MLHRVLISVRVFPGVGGSTACSRIQVRTASVSTEVDTRSARLNARRFSASSSASRLGVSHAPRPGFRRAGSGMRRSELEASTTIRSNCVSAVRSRVAIQVRIRIPVGASALGPVFRIRLLVALVTIGVIRRCVGQSNRVPPGTRHLSRRLLMSPRASSGDDSPTVTRAIPGDPLPH